MDAELTRGFNKIEVLIDGIGHGVPSIRSMDQLVHSVSEPAAM